MQDYSKILSDNITDFRKKKGYTQEMLAEKLGVTFQAVSKWENGQSCPDILTLPQLAEIFETSIDELFGKHTLELSWPDDATLRGVVFIGRKILDSCSDMSKFTFKIEGQTRDVTCACNLQCNGKIEGSANAGGDIICIGIDGNIDAGADVACGAVGGNINAGADVNCGDVSGDIDAGGDVNCGDVSGDIDADGDVACGAVGGNINADGDVNCGNVGGNIDAGGDVSCTAAEENINSDESTI